MGESEGGSRGRGVTRAAVIGYGSDAREQALRLRAIGWEVEVVVRSGGMTWIHAVADGFRPVPAAEAALRADVVVVHLPESEQPAVWAYGLAPYLAPGALVIFAHGSAVYSGAVDPDPRLDVALVTACTVRGSVRGAEQVCRVAVQRDATGHALERALAFVRAVFGSIKVETTTLDFEVRADLSELGAKMGGPQALMAEWDRVLASPSHEPDEGNLTYYERLRATVLAGGRKRGAA